MSSAAATKDLPLASVAVSVRPARRLTQLVCGLVLYAIAMAMQVRANLGLDPWDVLHQGLSRRTGLSFGTITALVGVVALLCWIPLRQRLGVGTVANIVVIGLVVDAALALVPTPGSLIGRVAMLLAGIVLTGLAGALYIGARLGPGPRDGLMTGLHARTGVSLRLVRTGIELGVLVLGWSLGGSVGVGTVLFALSIGPLIQAFLRLVVWRTRAESGVSAGARRDGG